MEYHSISIVLATGMADKYWSCIRESPKNSTKLENVRFFNIWLSNMDRTDFEICLSASVILSNYVNKIND